MAHQGGEGGVFQTKFIVLGAVIDVSRGTVDPAVVISNKPEQIEEIRGRIEEVSTSGAWASRRQPSSEDVESSRIRWFWQTGSHGFFYLTQKAESRGAGHVASGEFKAV